MSDWTNISDAIAAKLNLIADIGVIHKDFPLVTNWQEFIKEHVTTVGGKERIRSWMILRTAMRDEWTTQTQSYLNHEITLFCFFGYTDGITNSSTEAEFQGFMESVFTEFRTDYRVNNVFDTREPPEMIFDPVPTRFGKVGCHAGRIILRGQIDKTF